MLDNLKYVLNADGEPVVEPDLHKWAEEMQRPNKIIKQERHCFGLILVSTIFLGLDHSWADGPPLLFETMIFGGPHNGYQSRCSTKAEAFDMHEEATQLIRKNYILCLLSSPFLNLRQAIRSRAAFRRLKSSFPRRSKGLTFQNSSKP